VVKLGRTTIVVVILLSGCWRDDLRRRAAPHDNRATRADAAASGDAPAIAPTPPDAAASADRSELSLDAPEQVDAPIVPDGGPALAPDGPTAPTGEITCLDGMVLLPDFVYADVSVYSRPLDRVVVGSQGNRWLWIVDVGACSAQTLVLPRDPISLALHDQQRQVLVGMDGAVVSVDVATGALGSMTFFPGEADQMVADPGGRIYLAGPASSRGGHAPLMTVDLKTGAHQLGPEVDGPGRLVLHPDGHRLYWVPAWDELDGVDRPMVPFDVTGGHPEPRPLSQPYAFKHCGNVVFSEDGTRAVSGCGELLRDHPADAIDLQSDGITFQPRSTGRAIDFAHGEILSAAPIPIVNTYDGTTGAELQSYQLPSYDYPTARPPRYQSVAWNAHLRADGQGLYVLFEFGVTASRFGLAAYGPGAMASDRFIPVAHDPPDFYGPGGAPPPRTVMKDRSLDWNVRQAGFSRRRKLLLLATASPAPAVHLYDPATRADRAVSLPSDALSLDVRDDDDLAAVAHAGGVSLIDLASATARELPVDDVSSALLTSGGQAWLVSGPPTARVLRAMVTATGMVGAPIPAPPFASLVIHPDGTRAYATDRQRVTRLDLGASTAQETAHAAVLAATDCGSTLLATADRLFLDCGLILALDPQPGSDLVHVGSLEAYGSGQRMAFLPDGGQGALATLNSQSGRVYRPPLWAIDRQFLYQKEAPRLGQRPLPPLLARFIGGWDGQLYAIHGDDPSTENDWLTVVDLTSP
jgi:hypothetical protein